MRYLFIFFCFKMVINEMKDFLHKNTASIRFKA